MNGLQQIESFHRQEYLVNLWYFLAGGDFHCTMVVGTQTCHPIPNSNFCTKVTHMVKLLHQQYASKFCVSMANHFFRSHG